MSGSYEQSSPHHLSHADHYNSVYGTTGYVQPPLGSDSGSVSGSGSVYIPGIPPPEGFSPVHQTNKDYHPGNPGNPGSIPGNHPGITAHEHWNNNDRIVETSYDCY